jgi:hypothetical protein
MSLRARTLHQPWAWAVCFAGKSVENRTWRPPKDAIGQHLAIHAGKTFDEESARWIRDVFGVVVPRDVPKGAIVAVCRLSKFIKATEELSEGKRPWFCGPFGWLLQDVTPIEPVFCRGAQGLWWVSETDLAAVRASFLRAKERAA